MILVVAFDIGADLVEAPDYIVENASDYKEPFQTPTRGVTEITKKGW